MAENLSPTEELGRVREALKLAEDQFPDLAEIPLHEAVAKLVTTVKAQARESMALRMSLVNGALL